MKKPKINRALAGKESPDPLGITLPKKRSVVEHLVEMIREKILSGEMPPDSRLPTTQKLAEQWGTYVPAVHAALTILTNEGLMSRRPRKGTFVCVPDNVLTRVGIFAPSQMWTEAKTLLFARETFLLLEDFLIQRHITSTVWFENRRGEKSGTPFKPLIKAIEKREIHALIALNAGNYNAGWLNELPVPVIGFSDLLRYHVNFDYENFFKLALKALSKKGCRSVAVISSLGNPEIDVPMKFPALAKQFHIKTRQSWIRVDFQSPMTGEQFGYKQFMELWNQEEKPDAVIVYSDSVASGVVLAVSTLGIKAQQNVQLVFHRNSEIPFVCPFSATYVENSVRECVESFYDQLCRIYRGELCRQKKLSFHLHLDAPPSL